MRQIRSLEAFSEYTNKIRQQGKLTRQKAIRLKCFDCSGYSMAEIEKCHIEDCPLWEFRSTSARKNRRSRLKSKISLASRL